MTIYYVKQWQLNIPQNKTKQSIQSACSEPKFSKLVPQSLLLGPFYFYLQSGHGMKREINFPIIITTSKASGEWFKLFYIS